MVTVAQNLVLLVSNIWSLIDRIAISPFSSVVYQVSNDCYHTLTHPPWSVELCSKGLDQSRPDARKRSIMSHRS